MALVPVNYPKGVADRTVLLARCTGSAPTGRGRDWSAPRRHRMTTDVAICSPHDEIRLLLRGLLRLHRFRVAREATSPEALRELPTDQALVVLVDADLDEVGWAEAVNGFHQEHPLARVVLLTATRSPRVGAQAKAAGIAAVVHRPFAVHELIEAVNGASPGPSESGPPVGTTVAP